MKAGAAHWRVIGEQVEAQKERIARLAASLGVTITHWYNDNNTTATDPRIVRKDFEQLLIDLEAGAIRGVLFDHADRLARMEYDAARVNRLFLMNPSYIGRSVSGGTDLSLHEGRSLFSIQATMGGLEVAGTKRRVSGTNRRIAESGRARGAPRPFGWNDDRTTLHPEEAELVRAAILAIPGGKTIGEIRKEWIAAGYGPKPNRRSGARRRALNHRTVEDRLMNPRVCGYVLYLPQSERADGKRPWLPDHVLYKNGEAVRGNWEAIVCPAEWKTAVAVIEQRKEERRSRTAAPHTTSEKYLLSGIARCGECSFPMTANWYSKGSGARAKHGYRYACLSSLGGCGGVSRVGPPLEEHVTQLFLTEVRRTLGLPAEKPEIDDEKYDARIAEIDAEIADATARRKAKRISAGTALDLIEDLEAEKAELQKKRRGLTVAKIRRRTLNPALLDEWDTFTVSEKKVRMREYIRSALVHKAGRGKRFDPSLIEIVWASDDPTRAG